MPTSAAMQSVLEWYRPVCWRVAVKPLWSPEAERSTGSYIHLSRFCERHCMGAARKCHSCRLTHTDHSMRGLQTADTVRIWHSGRDRAESETRRGQGSVTAQLTLSSHSCQPSPKPSRWRHSSCGLQTPQAGGARNPALTVACQRTGSACTTRSLKKQEGGPIELAAPSQLTTGFDWGCSVAAIPCPVRAVPWSCLKAHMQLHCSHTYALWVTCWCPGALDAAGGEISEALRSLVVVRPEVVCMRKPLEFSSNMYLLEALPCVQGH